MDLQEALLELEKENQEKVDAAVKNHMKKMLEPVPGLRMDEGGLHF